MSLPDYTPVLQWYADSLSGLDEPTGATKSNPGGLTDPTIAGTPDAYADFDGSAGISFLPGSPLLEVGTGDITIVMKARVDTFTVSDVIWENFNGAGSAGVSHGLRLYIESGVSRRIALLTPPRSSGFRLESSTNALTAAQDFICAFRRLSGTWSLWLSADASGGMTADTPQTNTIGSSVIDACGDVSFFCDRTGASATDGRLYWLLAFNAAISDADMQLATWATESSLKTLWPPSGGGASPVAKIMQMLLAA